MPWPDVKGKRCLDVWTFDDSLRFEMAGYRVTHLAGDPGCRGASKGAGFGLALRDSVVRPTSAFASRHRQPGSADTFGARRAAQRSDDLTARHLCADGPAHTLDRSAVRGPAPLVGAIYRMRGVHHGSDLSERNTILVQVGVYVLGNVVWRPTPPEIVADEVCVISRTGTSTRSASNQSGANQQGDGESGQPAT